MPTDDSPARLVFCPICHHSDPAGFGPVHPGAPDAVRCDGCGLAIETSLGIRRDSYRTTVYDAARNAGSGGDRWRGFHHDSAVAGARLLQLEETLRGLPPTGRRPVWLDVGCGNAALLVLLRRRGWAVAGVESDADSCNELADLLGITAINFSNWSMVAQTTASGPTQVVSFFDSLEHMIDPFGALLIAAASVAIGGLIVVEAPDLDSAVDFPNWKHRRITPEFTEHIWHFSERSMEAVRAAFLPGFETVRFGRPVPGRFQLVWRKDRKPADPYEQPVDVQASRPFTIHTH